MRRPSNREKNKPAKKLAQAEQAGYSSKGWQNSHLLAGCQSVASPSHRAEPNAPAGRSLKNRLDWLKPGCGERVPAARKIKPN